MKFKDQEHGAYFDAKSDNADESFGCKFDGCIHIRRFYNGASADDEKFSDDDSDYMHVCDPLKLTSQLIDLCRHARTQKGLTKLYEEFWPTPAEFVAALFDDLTETERAQVAKHIAGATRG